MRVAFLTAMLVFIVVTGKAQESTQDHIDDAFIASFMEQENMLAPMIASMEGSDEAPSDYWRAYAHFREGVYLISTGQQEAAQKTTAKGIEILDAKEELNSEEHTLLGTLLGFSIAFEPGKAMVLSSTSNRHFTEALEKNDQNMRAHLGIGRGDYYRPVEYGGGQVVEMHLQKALSLPKATSDDPGAPSWGRDEAFMFLAMYYQREERKAEGILICKRGLKEFPGHQELTRIMGELEKS